MSLITEETTRRQSLNAYNQWKDQWRDHAKYHSQYKMKSLKDFDNVGVGKAILLIGNGASFEENIDTIKRYQDQVDILTCDKTLGHCLKNGIIPTYCMVCDANVSYETYLEPYKDQLKNTILFSNVCGNKKWTDTNLWKDVYFFVNADVINSEIEFSKLSGCNNVIPAATNVSGEMVVLITQCDNNGRRNAFGYDKILLIGFDYSWEANGNYYSFNPKGNGKHHYMRHIQCINLRYNIAYTSTNLYFSMEWLKKYCTTFKLPVVNCTRSSIFEYGKPGNLEEHMQYSFKREDASFVKSILDKRKDLYNQVMNIDKQLNQISKDHYYGYLASV